MGTDFAMGPSNMLLLIFLAVVSAWLPAQHKELVTSTGTSLFKSSPFATKSTTWQSDPRKIRGVNLGSMFIIEPWMANNEWNNIMGCNHASDEFDCVKALGQSKADTTWAAHWARWFTQSDISQMVSYGLNTIRIPVGYWVKQDLKYSTEYFPNGALAYLGQVCGWASDAGMYIIIDLHAAPAVQTQEQAFTGLVSD